MNKPAPPIFEPTIIRKTIFGPRPSLRTRQVCLSMKDWKDFAGALQDACPAAWYLRELTQEEKRSENKPDWRPTDHLCGHMERPDKLPFEIDMILDPDWRMDIIRLGPDSYSKWRAPSYGFPLSESVRVGRSESPTATIRNGSPEAKSGFIAKWTTGAIMLLRSDSSDCFHASPPTPIR